MSEYDQKARQDEESNLVTDYANSTFFEPTVMDLKILFGEWSGRLKGVDWHTAVTIPWVQAKLMSYFLELNIAVHESTIGKIQFPSSMIPAEPPPLTEEQMNDPKAEELRDIVIRSRNKFIESLK